MADWHETKQFYLKIIINQLALLLGQGRVIQVTPDHHLLKGQDKMSGLCGGGWSGWYTGNHQYSQSCTQLSFVYYEMEVKGCI